MVDAVLRAEADEAVLSRASALGWSARGDVAVVLGAAPAQRTETDVFDEVRRVARAAGMDALCATQGERLVVRARRRRGRRARPPRRGRAVRRGSGRRRPGRPTASSRGPPLGPGRARRRTAPRPAGRTRRGRCAATSCCPSGRWPVTGTPAATSSTTSTSRSLRARGTLIETLAAYFDRGGSLEGAAGRCSCTPTPSATGCGRCASSPASPRRCPRRVHAADRRWCWAASPVGRRSLFVETLQRPRARFRPRRRRRTPPGRRQSGSRARHRRARPGRPDPRLPRPRGSRTRRSPPASTWLATVADLDLVHYGTEADADDHPRHRDRPAAARRDRAGRRARAVPAPGRRVRPRSARSPATASASSPPPPAPG